MPKQEQNPVAFLNRNRFALLLIGLVLLFFYGAVVSVFPLAWQSLANRLAVGFLLTFLVVAATLAVDNKSSHIALLLGIPAVLTETLDLWLLRDDTQILSHLFGMLFVGYVISRLFKYIFIGRRVTTNTIFASLCVYLLLATFWTYAYSLLDLIDPPAFSSALIDETPERIMRLGAEPAGIEFYYSLVTMTTLGYGDIIPITPASRSLATLQAVVGQLYLTVIVARLVGLHVTESAEVSE
jgi:hypothetical protein